MRSRRLLLVAALIATGPGVAVAEPTPAGPGVAVAEPETPAEPPTEAAPAVAEAEGSPAEPAPVDPCAAWPGEPDPLPQLADADPVLARWAELRAAELAARAEALEDVDPVEAYRLWRRFQCFDPGSPDLRRAFHRTRPVRIHRPEVVRVRTAHEEGVGGEGWQVLGQPLAVARPAASPATTQRARLLADIDRWIGATEDGLRSAHFDEALEAAAQARDKLSRTKQRSDLDGRWIRLELAEATVHVARGSDEDAAACAERALARQPALDLDENRYPPKLVRLFEGARAGARP